MRNELKAVTDAQQGDPLLQDARVCRRSIGIVDRARTTGKDQTSRSIGTDLLQRRSAGQHNGKNTHLPDPAGDQLRVLRAKIEDDNGLVLGLRVGRHVLVCQKVVTL
jgi:hypothetical protein